MNIIGVGEDEDPVGKRADVHSLHRRSKSASDKTVGDASRLGVTNSVQKHSNLPHDSPASRRACGSQTPRRLPIDPNASSSNPRASLEKDIQLLQLRLQQEKSMREMLERAIGRASSTLSPGHKHFGAQTKELIAEIELLEEEVANREQHVLSLYRDIFEQCVSRPPSEQCSGLNSPARSKMKPRKHPSIIKSAFCSSKKFPLQPFRVLSSKSSLEAKEIKTKHASMSAGKSDLCFEIKTKHTSNIAKEGRSTTTEKASMIKTLKDHLYQCPSKLSEEMVRCMAAVYCWLLSPTSLKSENQSSDQSCSQEAHACKSLVEISSMPPNKNQLPSASYAINNYRALVEQLERVNISQMGNKAQIAFWINVYNSLVMHAYLAYGIPTSSLRRLAMFHKAAYNIGGHVVSANTIEHTIFCFHTHRIGGWLETILSTAMRKKSGSEKQAIGAKFGLPNSHSLVCFALCTGSFSDPVLKVYTASNLTDQLEAAKREFLSANVIVKNHRKLFLPRLLERYAREVSIGTDDLIKWLCLNSDKNLRHLIEKCLESQKANKKAVQITEWLPYSSKFRYLISKELAIKPWWV